MATDPVPPTPSPPSRRARRRWLLVLAVATLVAAGWLGRRAWRREPPVAVPPTADTRAAEPVVAAAVEDARQEVLASPRSAPVWGKLGMVLMAHGYAPEAAACFAEAHRLDATDDRWPYLHGLLSLSSDPDTAVRLLETAFRLPHRDPTRESAVRMRLAEAYLTRQRLTDAERLFRDELAQRPADPRANLGLGQTLLTADRPREAVPHLSASLDAPSSRRRATAQLAAAYQLLGDPAAARLAREAALMPDDGHWPDPFVSAYLDLQVGRRGVLEQAERLEAAGRLTEAARLLRGLTAERPDERSLTALAINLSKLGHHAEAERYLREVIRADPNHTQGHYFLGIALQFQAEASTDAARRAALYREAVVELRRATELKPDHGHAHLFLGKSLAALGDHAAAVDALRRAADCRPENPDVQLALVTGLADAGRVEEAREQMTAAEKVAPPGDGRVAKLKGRLGVR